MDGKYRFSNWTTAQKIGALSNMNSYVEKHAPECLDYWHSHGCDIGKTADETRQIMQTVANDETLFINALFAFFVAVVLDIDWMNSVAKAFIRANN